MTQAFKKGSYHVVVGKPAATAPYDDAQLLGLAAAASRNGSEDPVDLALFAAAKECQRLHFEQGSWSAANTSRRYCVAQLRDEQSGGNLRVARGELSSVLALASRDDRQLWDRADKAATQLEHEGFVPVGIATALDGGAWKFAGTVPVRVTKTQASAEDAPAEFRYVHVWDWPLRLLHWSWVLLIVVLATTGLMISQAWLLKTGDLTNGFAFGWIRLVHYTSGFLLAAVLIVRAGRLFFASTKYARWPALLPLSWRRLKDAAVTAKHYLFMESWKSPRYIGHNPLQQWAYSGILVVFVLMAVSGFSIFAMYEPRHWFFRWFMFLNNWIGNANVRLLHTIGMWIILVFVPAHIYLSVLSGNVDREGTISSMISGGRWLRRGVRFEDE